MSKENGKLRREPLGQKKLAPINMKKEAFQFVIDGFLIEEVLKQIPEGIKIIQARVVVNPPCRNRKLIIPNRLKKLGVNYLRIREAATEIILVFDQVSKSTIIKNVKEACALQGMEYNRAYFQYIVLTNGKANGKFEHTTKEMRPDETDQRKKLRVLGLSMGQGPVQGLVADLGAKKYLCSVREETVRLLMCSKA